MGALTEAGLDQLIDAGCRACGKHDFIFQTYVDGRLPLMAGEPVGTVVWAYDGEKFVDGVFRVNCEACGAEAFSSSMCPRCNTADKLGEALTTPNSWAVPTACPGCDDEEVRYRALIPAEVTFKDQRAGKARTATELLDPGFHGLAIDCIDCGTVEELTAHCPLCGTPGPLRARP